MHGQFLFALGIGIVVVGFIYWVTKGWDATLRTLRSSAAHQNQRRSHIGTAPLSIRPGTGCWVVVERHGRTPHQLTLGAGSSSNLLPR
jgi:hypothetical protein